jgi:hypothetical protein
LFFTNKTVYNMTQLKLSLKAGAQLKLNHEPIMNPLHLEARGQLPLQIDLAATSIPFGSVILTIEHE